MQAAEADLATEQAAVNAFRLHCRLKLDTLVDEYEKLKVEKQSLLTRWSLQQQAAAADDPFWQDTLPFAEEDEGEPLLPTSVPHDRAAEKRLYRQLARQFHPDLGRTALEIAYRTDMMAAVNNAHRDGNVQALYDLSGELDPDAVNELAAMENLAARKLRQQVLNCLRRQRKIQGRLQALRLENTARLWRKAQALNEAGTDWWEVVRRELSEAISRRTTEIEWLMANIAADDSGADDLARPDED